MRIAPQVPTPLNSPNDIRRTGGSQSIGYDNRNTPMGTNLPQDDTRIPIKRR